MNKWIVLAIVILFFVWIIYLRMQKDQAEFEARQRKNKMNSIGEEK